MPAKILDWWFYLALTASLGTGLLFFLSDHAAVREAAASASISFLGASGAVQAWKTLLGGHQYAGARVPGGFWPSIGFMVAASAVLVWFGVSLAR